MILPSAQEWKNRTTNATNLSIVYFIVLPGSQSTFTEITEYTHVSLIQSWGELQHKIVENIVPLVIMNRETYLLNIKMFVGNQSSISPYLPPVHNQIYSRNWYAFLCWNSQSFHLNTGGVSHFTTQKISWTGSFRTFIVHGRHTAPERVRKRSEFGRK